MADWYKRWYHVELDPATEIQPLIGSKEGILHVTLALVNPGDQVLVPNPGYPTYTSLNKILGSEIASYYRPGHADFWISSSQRLSPAGQPSTTTPMPLPWDSPHVVIRNKLPNDEPDINASLKTLIF